MSVAAHLIHGSSDGRFNITYCTKPENLTEEAVRGVSFGWMDYEETIKNTTRQSSRSDTTKSTASVSIISRTRRSVSGA